MQAYHIFSYALFSVIYACISEIFIHLVFLIAILGEGNVGKIWELLLANEFSNEIYEVLQCRIRCNGLLHVLLLITISGEDIRG